MTKKLRFEQKPFHVVLQLKTSNIKLKDQASIENIKFFINDCKLFIRKFSLDDFYFSTLKDSNKFKSFLAIISLILTFDDRQALVERGFSINKSMLLENMQELSLISCRKTKAFWYLTRYDVEISLSVIQLVKFVNLKTGFNLKNKEKEKIFVKFFSKPFLMKKLRVSRLQKSA